MNKKRNIVSTKIKNPILLVVLLIVATFLITLIYNNFLKATLDSVYSLKQSYEKKATLPILLSFNTASLERESFYQLKPHGILNYNQQVRAVATDKNTPMAPAAIEIIDTKTGGTLLIFWQEPKGADYQSVSIYRSEIGGQLGVKIAEKLSTSGNYKDTGLKDNQKYYFTIKSVNTIAGEDKLSTNTNYYEGMPTDKMPPAAPTNFQVVNTGVGSQLELSWQNPADEDLAYINIYRSEKIGTLDTDNQPVQVRDAEEYLDQEVQNNVVYYYTITAVDASGNESSKDLLLSSGGNSNPFFTPLTNANING